MIIAEFEANINSDTMSAVKDGWPIIWKQLAIRLSLFKQIVPKLYPIFVYISVCVVGNSLHTEFFLLPNGSVDFFVLSSSKLKTNWKFHIRIVCFWIMVHLLRHTLSLGGFWFWGNSKIMRMLYCLPWTTFAVAESAQSVLLKLHLIVSGLLMCDYTRRTNVRPWKPYSEDKQYNRIASGRKTFPYYLKIKVSLHCCYMHQDADGYDSV